MRLCAALALSVTAAYVIDTSVVGRRLDGYGAISGGGATSRLLFSYPQEQLDDILDFLFLPSHGASLHHLKVEIGGDGQSSEGVEPSHAHYEGDANYHRGYEWRLMVEARRRNPSILISGLAWTWPAWLGATTRSPWSDAPRTAAYVISWMRAARDLYNVTLDYIDAGWNERGWSADFVLTLRAGLDASGFERVGIVCGDDAHKFSCAAAAATNATLRGAIAALGVHGPDAPDVVAVSTGVPMWGSEVHVTDPGGSDLATVFATLYSRFNVTGYLLWNALSAYNPNLFSPDWGIFRAWWPWCGHYELDGKVWVFAHWTQATSPGFTFVPQAAGGAGNLSGGGEWTALVDAPHGAFTLVLSKPTTATAEVSTFSLRGPVGALTSLHAVRSRIQPGGDFGRNLSEYFVMQPDVLLTGGVFSLPIAPGDMWTLTTVSTMAKGTTRSGALPSPAIPFPLPYADTFQDCPLSQEAPFWTDMTGVFECVVTSGADGATVMRQMVPAKPLEWRNDEQRPFSVFAADALWASTDISIDVRLTVPTDGVLVGVRANPNDCCGRVISGEDLMPGVWLTLGGGEGYKVFNAISNVTTSEGILGEGPAPALTIGAWHTVRLMIDGNSSVSGWLDDTLLFTELGVGGKVPPKGWAGIGTIDYGDAVEYKNFFLDGG